MPFWSKKKDAPAPAPETTLAPTPASPVGASAAPEDEESPYFGKKINMMAFELCKTLGKGSFGHVMLVRKKDTGQLLAMKVLQKRNLMRRQQV
eukprot:SAG31_NODE_32106_length_360_cov_0.597701_1_plen_92_part_01